MEFISNLRGQRSLILYQSLVSGLSGQILTGLCRMLTIPENNGKGRFNQIDRLYMHNLYEISALHNYLPVLTRRALIACAVLAVNSVEIFLSFMRKAQSETFTDHLRPEQMAQLIYQ